MLTVTPYQLTDELSVLATQRWQQWQQQHQLTAKQLTEQWQQQATYVFAMSDFVFKISLQYPETLLLCQQSTLIEKQQWQWTEWFNRQELLLASESEFYHFIRKARQQTMVLIAIIDLCQLLPIEKSLQCLSELSDELVLLAYDYVHNQHKNRWGQALTHEGELMPLLIIAMGKLGGKELNFSSDIDLIFTFPESGFTQGGRQSVDHATYFTRIAQKLISILDKPTVDGRVFRVDMRLRPFGESGPLVSSFAAIEDYYQEYGREWERYALVKARIIGKSHHWHHELQQLLRPFIYRRYLDFGVLQTLRDLKQRIVQHHKEQLQHNIKLGVGGIREIEFLVQVFQLMRGGKLSELRQTSLLKTIKILVTTNLWTEQEAENIRSEYLFLRQLEQLLQIIADQQTQQLPESEENQQRVFSYFGMENWEAFLNALLLSKTAVHQQYQTMIGEEAQPKTEYSQYQQLWDELDFDHLQKINNEHQLGTEEVLNRLAQFKQHSQKVSMGTKGHEYLDQLMPYLLYEVFTQLEQLKSLNNVLHVLEQILSRSAYLQLLLEQGTVRKHLIYWCQQSDWISEKLAQYPLLLDELIDPNLLKGTIQELACAKELARYLLAVPQDLEQQLNVLCEFKLINQLRIAMAELQGLIDVTQASQYLTQLAEVILREVAIIAWQQIEERFGAPEAQTTVLNNFGLIGYGKLGGKELSYQSDLDIVFVYDSQENSYSTGPKIIDSRQWFLKLAQKIINLMHTRTWSGSLYELDPRLRPSGNSGLLAVHINTYQHYLERDAWVWEHQALVRARMIISSQALDQQFNYIREKTLALPLPEIELREAVVAMRQKMKTVLPQKTLLSKIKQNDGGIVDIEFLVQYWVLFAAKQGSPVQPTAENTLLLKQLVVDKIINLEVADELANAYKQLRQASHEYKLTGNTTVPYKELMQQVSQLWQIVFNIKKIN